jgi:hypothetical protein
MAVSSTVLQFLQSFKAHKNSLVSDIYIYIYIYNIQGVSGGIVNIFGGGSMDYSK